MQSIIDAWMYLVANASYLVGFVMPPLVEILNKDVKSSRERFAVSVGSCVLAAILLHWHELVFGSPQNLLASAGLIFTESQVVYKLYFENSWLRHKMAVQ